jgi:hypothetical protein
MQERRSFPRRYLMFYSRVFNLKTGELVGHIVDITPTGAMLISETPLETEVNYHLITISSRPFMILASSSLMCPSRISI